MRALRRQLVVAGERNEHMITNSAYINDDLRGKRFRQSAAEMVNHGRILSRPRLVRARKNGWLALLLVLISCMIAGAAEPWILLPEPKFMAHHITRVIPAAKSTELAVMRFGEFGPEFARKETWEGISEETLWADTRKAASEWFQKVKPEYVRDRKNVVQYAVLKSEEVPVAATVLAPEFWKQFEGVFGAKMRVVIPNRNTVIVIPDIEGDLDAYTPMVMQAWRSGLPKVSLELFQLTEKGLQTIGAFEEP